MSIELAVGLGIVAWFGALAALDFAGIPASTPTYPGRPSLRLQPLPEAIARRLVPPNEGGPPPTPLGAEIFLHVMDDYRHSGAPSGLCGLLVEGEFPQPGTWPCDLTLRLGGGAFVLHLEKPELYRDICEAVGSGTIGAPGRAEGVAVVEGVAEAAGLSLSPAASGPGPGPLPVVYIGGPTDSGVRRADDRPRRLGPVGEHPAAPVPLRRDACALGRGPRDGGIPPHRAAGRPRRRVEPHEGGVAGPRALETVGHPRP